MTESIFNNNWGKVALGSVSNIKISLQSDVTGKKEKKRKAILIGTSIILQSGKANTPGQQVKPYRWQAHLLETPRMTHTLQS